MGIFIIAFGVLIFVVVDLLSSENVTFKVYGTIAFVFGSVSSILCGYIGMRVAVITNYRVAYLASYSLDKAFKMAYMAGNVMGFFTVSFEILGLLFILIIYQKIYVGSISSQPDQKLKDYSKLFEFISAYGLGGSAMALFGRVGGGIYTKAADVGADIVGKVEHHFNEDSPKNPATIADNVGDNVGDIAGMGSDLFGSMAEASCATLVILGTSPLFYTQRETIYFPLLISAAGIAACFITSVFGNTFQKVDQISQIEKFLKNQLIISTFITLLFIFLMNVVSFNDNFNLVINNQIVQCKRFYPFLVSAIGCVSGLIIGLSTDYYTSNAHNPVKEMAKSCSSGAAINIIYGLAVGYMSNGLPILLIGLTTFFGIYLLGFLGVALAALGILSTLPISLAIDVYGPISDNAGGIVEMSELGENVRFFTDALDAAGNTTAAIGKGFAIGSAAFVCIALYGAFITRLLINEQIHSKEFNVLEKLKITEFTIFFGLIFGSLLPYIFSAMTMKSVGSAANEMVQEIRRQFKNSKIRNGEVEPDFKECIRVSTQASLKQMIMPGLLVIMTPILFGFFLDPKFIIGIIPGALLTGVNMAISMSNTGGAWDNTKKYIESGQYYDEHGMLKGKNSDEHKAAVIGDTVGDPLKDTSGPSLNILIKLMAIISVVFVDSFYKLRIVGRYFDF